MTFLESITYQTGRFLELSQYVLKNAYRVACLFEGSQNLTPYTRSVEALDACESKAKEEIIKNQDKGSKELVAYFTDKGLSIKDFNSLKKMLERRDYLLSHFFLDYSSGFAREEIEAYQSAIDELKKYVDDADKLNISLAKTATKLYECFH
jgi:hypothetical protein